MVDRDSIGTTRVGPWIGLEAPEGRGLGDESRDNWTLEEWLVGGFDFILTLRGLSVGLNMAEARSACALFFLGLKALTFPGGMPKGLNSGEKRGGDDDLSLEGIEVLGRD